MHRPTVRTPVPIVSATPFNYLHHLVTVPVVVGGEVETRFVLDTGIGLTLVSEEVGEAIGLTIPLHRPTHVRPGRVAPTRHGGSLSLGTFTQDQHTVGILDTGSSSEELSEIGGFLSRSSPRRRSRSTIHAARSSSRPRSRSRRASRRARRSTSESVETGPPSISSCRSPSRIADRSRSRSTWVAIR